MNRESFALSEAPHGPLRGDVYWLGNPRGAPVVVGCHGFKGFKDWGFWPELGDRMTAAGLVLVTFNFSGSGIGVDPGSFTELDRFEANTIGREIEDLGVVLDALVARDLPTQGADGRKLGVLGHSRGGGVALVRASRDPRIRSLVTWAAVASFDRVDAEEKEAWKERGYAEVVNQRTGQVFRLGASYLEDLETHGEAYDPCAAARRLQIPTLIVHGTRDESVPVDEAQELSRNLDRGRSQLALIQDAGHTFGAVHPFAGSNPDLDRVMEKTVTWFRKSLG